MDRPAIWCINKKSQYYHRPLPGPPGFRLVRLLPGLNSDSLSCELADVQWKHDRDFGILSLTQSPSGGRYTSITDRPLKEINTGTFIRIDKNTYQILNALRKLIKGCSFKLWVESVCVDMSCLREVVRHVQQLAHILQGARKIVRWNRDKVDVWSTRMRGKLRSEYFTLC
jgi:hypothetical protein